MDARMLVDCDIHIGYETLSDLLPYLDPPTRELVIHSGSNGLVMPSYPWNHPTGWVRHDLYDRHETHDSNFTYLSLEVLRERHLDAYDVTLGIVEPDEAAAFSILPNAQLAARLCSAYNDWLLERWLQEEPRLRGMLVVPAQYPEAAAREIRRLGGRDEFVGVFLPGAARIPYGNQRFPGTRVAMVEGGLVPFVGFLWRLDANWKACRSEIPWCRRRPSDYVWEHVRFATQPLESPDDPAQLLAAIEFLRPAETLMYASDFPHWDFDEPEQTLRQLPAEWRDSIRARNAVDFFRLPLLAAV